MAADADGSVRARALYEHMEARSWFKGENAHGAGSVCWADFGKTGNGRQSGSG